MAANGLLLRDVIGGFAPGQSLRAALMCTFSFDGAWLEEGLVPDLFDRQVATCLVLRDANALIREAPSVRYHRANAQSSTRVFHSKLLLLVADDRALAVAGSANLTRGGLERNLELGSVHEVSPEGGPRAFFQQLHVTGATVTLSLWYPDHGHGAVAPSTTEPTPGHFAATVNFPMAGTCDVTVTAVSNGRTVVKKLSVRVP